MNESTKSYRKGELDGLEPYDGQYNLKLIGINGTESKWMSITEEELENIKGILSGDTVNTALHMLTNAGYVTKTYGADDVHEVLDQFMNDNASGVIDTVTHREAITRHVMEGRDWRGVLDSEEVTDYIWSLIEDTNNEHPDWFPEVKPADPFAEDTTPDLMDEYINLRIKAHELTHADMGRFVNLGAELRERGIIN